MESRSVNDGVWTCAISMVGSVDMPQEVTREVAIPLKPGRFARSRFLLWLGPVLCLLLGCSGTGPKRMSSAADSGQQVSLRLAISGRTSPIPKDLRDIEFAVLIDNRSNEEVHLDGRLLNLAAVLSVLDSQNKQVVLMPPSLPREFDESDINTVRAGTTYEARFRLRELTVDPLNGASYKLQVEYDPADIHYPEKDHIYAGKLTSDVLILTHDKTGWMASP
jgi:hypothetical protein